MTHILFYYINCFALCCTWQTLRIYWIHWSIHLWSDSAQLHKGFPGRERFNVAVSILGCQNEKHTQILWTAYPLWYRRKNISDWKDFCWSMNILNHWRGITVLKSYKTKILSSDELFLSYWSQSSTVIHVWSR